MKFDDATNLDRKSGGAEWRDLLFCWEKIEPVSCPRGSAKPVEDFKESRTPGRW
jgi:hypothetical protein